MNSRFENLKREANKLERQLEDKVARYQQLAQRSNAESTSSSNGLNGTGGRGVSSWNRMENGVGGHKQQSSLGGGSNINSIDKEQAVALQNDIQRSLQALQDWIATRLDPASETSHHRLVVKRYREILFDLTGDYQKAQQVWQRSQERMELFRNVQGGSEQENGDNPAASNLWREQNHIQNSINGAMETMNQASSIHNNLRQQGTSLGRASSGIGAIISSVPGINGLVDSIRRKRSKDDVILAGVIASCILFTLFYLFG